jgi:hypothetical protein
MRLLLGMVLGVFLMIGVAYEHDASVTAPSETTSQTGVEQR